MRTGRAATIASALALLFLVAFSGPASASPLPGEPPASVGSDKADYAPGSVVTLAGANWQPGESVHIYVNDDQGMTWTRDADVTAAADGTIEDTFTLPDWFVASYSVKATGASSGLVATASFTDGNVSFALATSGQSAPSNLTWSVSWKHYSNSSCTTEDGSGTANYSGNTLSSGSQPSVGNNQWAKPTASAAPGYALDYWSSSPTSTTPLTSAQLCAAGPANTTVWAHFKPSKQDQTIAFTAPASLAYGDADVDPGATASSGLPVSYASSTPAVCTIVSAKIHVVAAGACTVTASQGGNTSYNAAPDAPRTFAIAKAVLSVNATDASKVYGDANPTPSSSLSGFKNGEDAAGAGVSGGAVCSITATAGPGAGSYADAITCAPGTLSAANYSFVTGSNGKLTIGKAPLSVTADDKSRQYGDANPDLTGTLTGVKNGDPVSGSYSTTADKTSGVGDYAIAAHVGGTDAVLANYETTLVNGVLHVAQAPLTVTADRQTKVYGDRDPDLTYRVTSGSLVNGDGFSGSLERDAGESVAGGPYAIRHGSLTAGGNYDLTFVSAGLTVTPKPITGSFTAADKVYDGDAKATITGSSLDAGVLDGDTVMLDAAGAAAQFGSKTAGQGKTVTGSGFALLGADKGNYALSMKTATASISPKPITGGFSAANKVYDGTPSASIGTRSLTGALSGDAVALTGGTASFADKNAGQGKAVTGSGFALSGADSGNYSLSGVDPTTANIAPKDVTGSFTAADKVFDGTTAATITGRSLAGTVANDDIALSGGTATFADPSVGQGKTVTGTGFALTGADKGNYNLVSVAATTASITYAAAGASCVGSAGHTILQPINVDGSSVFKQGSTVPAKFRVCDANGNSVGTAGVVTSFKQVQTLNGVESTVNETPDSTTPDTAFRWSASDQQWIYNLTTKSLTAGRTYTYRVMLNDGTSFDFKFGLK